MSDPDPLSEAARPQPTVARMDSPEAVMQAFQRAVASGELEWLLALYEPEAVFEQADSTYAGQAQIRPALARLLALRPKLALTTVALQRTRDLALARNDWTLEGTTPDGSRFSQRGQSTVVLRQCGDAGWRIAIDRP